MSRCALIYSVAVWSCVCSLDKDVLPPGSFCPLKLVHSRHVPAEGVRKDHRRRARVPAARPSLSPHPLSTRPGAGPGFGLQAGLCPPSQLRTAGASWAPGAAWGVCSDRRPRALWERVTGISVLQCTQGSALPQREAPSHWLGDVWDKSDARDALSDGSSSQEASVPRVRQRCGEEPRRGGCGETAFLPHRGTES